MIITHVNPDTMHRNPYFSQGVLVDGGRTLYIGEQNGVDETGAIVAGGAVAQALQAIDQVKRVLAEVGADETNVVRLTAYFTKDASADDVIAASAQAWGAKPTALTVLQVYGLGRPDALVGIEAVAVID
jgi:enamine deaminase RidA (YjgF/YER057c/UK114 family)